VLITKCHVPDEVIAELVEMQRRSVQVIVYLSPRLQVRLTPRVPALANARIRLTGPLEYPQLLALAQRARLIVTDSGGLQEEATVLKKPIIVVRRSNERPEIEGVFGCRIPPTALLPTLAVWINDRRHTNLYRIPSPYGDGAAAMRIAREARRLGAATRRAGA
jgi:UDP-N-acetylglucosamine 2-epimerase (non-hydrolysing)